MSTLTTPSGSEQLGVRRRSFQSGIAEEANPNASSGPRNGSAKPQRSANGKRTLTHGPQPSWSIKRKREVQQIWYNRANNLLSDKRTWSVLGFCFFLFVFILRLSSSEPNGNILRKREIITKRPDAVWFKRPVLEEFDPFTYVPRHREKKLRVLFLHDYKTAVETYDSFVLDVYKAAQEHPYVEPHLWGPNFIGYNLKQSFVKNVEKHYGCGYFDIVYSSYGRHIPLNFPAGAVRYWDSPVDKAFGCGTVFVVKTGDCNLGQCPDEHFQWLGNITAVRYAPELTEVYSYDRLAEMRHKKLSGYPNPQFQLYAHVPDSAHTANYYPPANWEDKKEDVKLFGKADPYYPLRVKIAGAIDQKKTFIKPSKNVSPMKPPNATFLAELPDGEASDLSSSVFDFYHANDAAFAADLRNTKICVFDGSVQMKAIRKYMQASLTACVIAGELPTEHDRMFADHIIELRAEWSIEEINSVLKAALANPTDLKRRAAYMYAYASQHFTSIREMDLVLETVDRYRAGDRGYMATHDFRSVCRDYYPKDEPDPDVMKTPHMLKTRPNWRYVPPWCTGKDFAV